MDCVATVLVGGSAAVPGASQVGRTEILDDLGWVP